LQLQKIKQSLTPVAYVRTETGKEVKYFAQLNWLGLKLSQPAKSEASADVLADILFAYAVGISAIGVLLIWFIIAYLV
jgi:hypothetical protein